MEGFVFQFIRRAIAALLNRFRPFRPPHIRMLACGNHGAAIPRPKLGDRGRRAGAPDTS